MSTTLPALEEIRVMGRRLREAPTASLVDELLALTHACEAKVARYAVLALAGAEGEEKAEQRLLELWDDPLLKPEMRRAVVKTLGVVGGPRAKELITHHNHESSILDLEFQRLRQQALLILARRLERAGTETDRPRGSIRDDVAIDRLRVRLACRNGLERITCVDLAESRILGPGRLELWHRGPLAALFRARTFESLALTLPPQPVRNGDIAAAAAAALTSEQARRILSTLTSGAIRYRLAWKGDGRQNQLVWRIAELAQALWPDLVNDPRSSTWEAELHPRGDQLYVDLVPKALIDPRFAYRQADVPAASHPPLAAALARIGGVKADDVVWDPFAGSGTELVERALLGPAHILVGTDRDPSALRAASANIAAAKLSDRVRLIEADALTFRDLRPTLILTNPPLGRRVARSEGGELLDTFLTHAAALLAPGGRLVWVSPDARRHGALAQRLGLRIGYEQRVDMGGFPATVQRFDWLPERANERHS
jgi:predicted RNA methylase